MDAIGVDDLRTGHVELLLLFFFVIGSVQISKR